MVYEIRCQRTVVVKKKGIKIEKSEVGDKVIFYLDGEIDLTNNEYFHTELEKCIKNNIFNIIIHMANLRYIDSSGIGVIIKNLKAVVNKGGDIKFVCIPDHIMNIFKYVRLDRLFDIYNNEQKAIEAFK
ncbi:MAG: STAS domain-containing protein [Candidatus Hydrogenedentota bacterium]